MKDLKLRSRLFILPEGMSKFKEVSKSILILKNLNDPTTDIELSLFSRGFHIQVVYQPREAIQYITESRPDYSLMSADLLPKRSAWLLGVLNQLTNVIVFVGRMTAQNLSVTRELNGCYLLPQPLNPLGLEQIFRRIEKDQNKQNELTSRLNGAQLWIMSSLAELSLKAICIPGVKENQPVEKVRRLTRMTCLRVQTSKLSGYFLMAFGQNRTLDSSWLSQIKSQLEYYMSSFEDELLIDSMEQLSLEEVSFNEWTKSQADFILQSIHENAELVMAFFQDPVGIIAKPSSHEGHVELNLDAIPETKMDFDIYVYLPQNARFVLYNSRGENFSATKKNKLVSQGIHTVHISKRSLDIVRHHHMQKFVDANTRPFREASAN